jgi:hypothetical protein
MSVNNSPLFEISPAMVLKTISMPFPATTRHQKTAVCQSALQEGIENGLKIAAHEPGNPDTRTDQGGFKNVGDGTTYQQFNACFCHLSRPSEGIPALEEHALSSHLTAPVDLYQAQTAGYVKDRGYTALPVCYRYQHIMYI